MYLQDLTSLKLRRARSGTRPASAANRRKCSLGSALDQVRATLQDMSAGDRREAILEMPQKTRLALVTFMQSRPTGSPADKVPTTLGADTSKKRKSPDAPGLPVEPPPEGAQQTAHIRAIRGSGRTRFQASARFRGVRFYTPEHSSEAVAWEHRRILTRLLAVLLDLEASSPQGWQDVAADACRATLSEAGTSEGALGLRAFIFLRAHKHAGRNAWVTSPAESLCRTFEMHRRLCKARDTSWSALRAEWVQLLQLRRDVSASEAARHIDGFRRAKLRGQLAAALQNVDHALIRRKRRPSG